MSNIAKHEYKIYINQISSVNLFYCKVLIYFYSILLFNFTYYFSYSEIFFFNITISNISYLYSLFIIFFLLFTLILLKYLQKLGLIKNIEILIGVISMFTCLYYYIILGTLSAIIFLFELQSLVFIYLLVISYPNSLTRVNYTSTLLNKYSYWFFNSLILQFWISFLTSIFFIYALLNVIRFTSFVEWNKLNIFYFFSSNFHDDFLKQNWLIIIIPLLLALTLKIGTFPFFLWKPEIYKNLNSFILYLYMTIYLFGVIFFMILFFYSYLYFFVNIWSIYVFIIIIPGLFILSLAVYSITEFRPFLAYTSALHICYIFIALCSNNSQGANTAMFYLIIYLFYTIMFFLILFSIGGQSLWFFTDINKLTSSQFIVTALSVFMVGVSGIPPFFGFIAKTSISALAFLNSEYLYFILILFSGIYVSFFYIQNYRFYGVYSKRIHYAKPLVFLTHTKNLFKILMYFIIFNLLTVPLSSDLFVFTAYLANLI